MNKQHYIIILLILIVSISCNPTMEKVGEFNLLPHPQEFEMSGVSSLKNEDVQNYFSTSQKRDPNWYRFV